MEASTISPQQLAERSSAGTIDLLDVRTPVEFREAHLAAARNLPLDRLDATQLIEDRKGKAEEPVYFICQTGSRSLRAC